MAKTRLYQLFDTKAHSAAGPIMAAKRDAVVIREFHQVLGTPNTLPGMHPEDFQLMHIGEQDEETLRIEPLTTILVVATGSGWLEQQQRDQAAREAGTDRLRETYNQGGPAR